MTTFFSVDVETSGLTPATGHLLTVGVQPVQWDGGRWACGIPVYVRIDRGDELKNDARYWCDGNPTHDWWAQQSPEARAEAWEDMTLLRHNPVTAARIISEHAIGTESHAESRVFVANPVAFDRMWLTTLFDETGVPDPFHYRSLCLRSMKYGLRAMSAWGSDREEHAPKLPHHALSDAQAQALDLIAMLSTARAAVIARSTSRARRAALCRPGRWPRNAAG